MLQRVFETCRIDAHLLHHCAEAVRTIVHETLAPGDGGVIAVDRSGTIVMDFNTEGMYRAAADSAGRFEVAIWE